MNLGIDIGSSATVVYHCGKGIALDEASVIAISEITGKTVACGNEAVSMIGRAPSSMRVICPVQRGVVQDYDNAEQMLREFFHRVCSDRITKPRVAVCVADNLTEVEQHSFIESVVSAGARRVMLVPETIATAIGIGLDVGKPCGQMVVNIGSGTTGSAVISLKGIASSDCIRIAGATLDESIVRYMRAQYGLLISFAMAETLKKDIGSAIKTRSKATAMAKGRDALTGLPRTQEVATPELVEAMHDPLEEMAKSILRTLEKTPPELAGDVSENGIWLAGGTALLNGFARFIERRTGVPCRVAENPVQCTAIGTGKALQYASSFREVYDLGSFSYRLSDSVTN